MPDYTVGDTVYKRFTTRAFATGIPTVLAGTPVVSAYEDDSVTQITAGITLGVDHDSVGGLNLLTIVATGANGYEAGKSYDLTITTGTVGGVSVVGEVVWHFTLSAEAAAVDLANGTDGLGAIKTETAAILAGTVTNAQGADVATDVANMIDANNRVDVGSWLGTAVTTSSTSAKPEVDAFSISDDATSANNLELQYDTTGLSGGTFPASQAQVGGIGASSGAALNFEAQEDNVFTDTIDNAAAVDKGGGLVGIPVTGHPFSADKDVLIAGTTNYNGTFAIVSQTTNEVVITDTFVSETFAGSETIVSSIKGAVFIGVQTSNTFASTEAEDNVYHVIDDVGNAIDIAYGYSVGGARTASRIVFKGYLSSANDALNIQAYDFIGADWETRAILSGQGGATNIDQPVPLLSKHTGSGTDIGKVFIRFVGSAQTNPTLNVDELLTEAVSSQVTVGYVRDAAISFDDTLGTAGIELGVNGTADNPSDTLADATTLTASANLQAIHLGPSTTATFAQTYNNFEFSGGGGTIAFGGQDIGGSRFFNLTCSGVSSGSTRVVFRSCAFFAAATLELAAWVDCAIATTITLSAANTYRWRNCDFSSSAMIDCGAVGAQSLVLDHYSGDMEIQNLAAGDTLHVHGTGEITLNANCSGGAFNHSSDVAITDNSGNVTITVDLASTDVIAINGNTTAPVQLAQNLDNCATGTASGTPTTTTMVSDISVTVDDQFNGRIITFDDDTSTAALRKQSTDITACTAASNTLTFTALTSAPSSGDTFTIT